MNYTSKFDGLSSEFLLVLTSMKDKAKKYPALNSDLNDLQAFYDATATLFAQADAEAVTARVQLILLQCEKKDTEDTIASLLNSLMTLDPDGAQQHMDKFLA